MVATRLIHMYQVLYCYTLHQKDVAVWPKWTCFYSSKSSALCSVLVSKTAVTNTCH